MPSIPVIIPNGKYKRVEFHELSDIDFTVYRELQWLSEMTPTEEVKRRLSHIYPKPSLEKSIQKLARLKYISMFDLSKFGGEGIEVMAN